MHCFATSRSFNLAPQRIRCVSKGGVGGGRGHIPLAGSGATQLLHGTKQFSKVICREFSSFLGGRSVPTVTVNERGFNRGMKKSGFPLVGSVHMMPFATLGPVTQIRFYARRTRTTTRVEEETRTDTTTTGVQSTKPSDVYQQEQQKDQYDDENISTEEMITDGMKKHLTKVYGTMMAGIGMAAVGSVFGILAPGLAIIGALGGFASVIALCFIDRSKISLRQNLFLGTGLLMGMSLGPLLATTAPGVVFAALLGTSAIFGGFSLAALKAKRRSMIAIGGVLFGCLVMLLVLSLSSILLPLMGITSPALLAGLKNILLYGGLALFSLFVGYDTQRMIEDYAAGDRDHVSPALNMFLNLFNIFIRLIHIFRGD